MVKIFILFFVSLSINALLGQNISFSPMATHYYNSYNVTVSGNGTLYYTTDGSVPNLNSSSAINNFNVPINQNKEIKVFLVDSSGTTTQILSRKYYTGQLSPAKIYFKPPQNWNKSCVMVDMVNPNSIDGFVIDTLLPGYNLQNTGCEGWYYAPQNIFYENANLYFNNCPLFQNDPNAQYANVVAAGNIILYDFSAGIISNPPNCLYLNNSESKANFSIIKAYPNPAEDFLKIDSKITFEKFIIFDASGRVVQQERMISPKLNISQLASGNYFIKLVSKDSGNEIIVKFIKK